MYVYLDQSNVQIPSRVLCVVQTSAQCGAGHVIGCTDCMVPQHGGSYDTSSLTMTDHMHFFFSDSCFFLGYNTHCRWGYNKADTVTRTLITGAGHGVHWDKEDLLAHKSHVLK